MTKTPQVKPDWNTGIYIGDGVVAAPLTDEDKEISKKDWFTSGEISWEEYWNDPSWETE